MNDNDPAVMYLVVRKDHTYALAQLLSDGATAVCRVMNAYSRETMRERQFEAWRGALYRKVTLRASMKELAALVGFPSHAQGGVTVFAPCRRSERPKALARLQTYDAAVSDLDGSPAAEHEHAVRIVVNGDVPMSVGKMLAQVGHAAMLAFETLHDPHTVAPWSRSGFPCVVTFASGVEWEALARGNRECIVADAGFTEVPSGTETCFAVTGGAQ
jgi:peptidyl-tRNA hydrolase